MQFLRNYIRYLLENDDGGDDKQDNLLTEPDEPGDPDENAQEQSVAANIAGVTTPLGTGPTYPSKKRKRNPTWVANARAFGNAKLASKK